MEETVEVQILERIREHIGPGQIEEQLIAEETTQNPMEIPITSSTSTSSDRRLDEFANMLDSCIELLTPMTAQIENIERETETVAMLTKRMMEPPLMEPPLMEPPLMQPPVMESEQASSKHSVDWDHGKCSVLGLKRVVLHRSGQNSYITRLYCFRINFSQLHYMTGRFHN